MDTHLAVGVERFSRQTPRSERLLRFVLNTVVEVRRVLRPRTLRSECVLRFDPFFMTGASLTQLGSFDTRRSAALSRLAASRATASP